MKQLRALTLLLAGLPLVACASSGNPPQPTLASTTSSGDPGRAAMNQRLLAGRALFTGRCQRCHALPLPESKSVREWPGEVAGMVRKSGLSPEQTTLIIDYLVAAAQPAQPVAAIPAR